nr:hypothetical protein [Mesorhizobium ciceri]
MKKFFATAIAALTLSVSPAAFAQDASAPTPAYMIGSYDVHDEAGLPEIYRGCLTDCQPVWRSRDRL